MATKPKVVIIGTGGTIAGTGPSATGSTYTAGQLNTVELLATVDGLDRVADVYVETLFSKGSEDLGPVSWLRLAGRIQALADQPDVDGVVVTHGTDTLEEAAFFLDMVCKLDKPVVLTAAMRASTALGADGPANIFQAVLAAADRRLKHDGVLVAMNGLLLQGWQATKTSSAALDSFRSYPGGPVGQIVGEQLLVFRSAEPARIRGRFERLQDGSPTIPNVGIAYLHGGCGSMPLRVWRETEVKGLVVAAFGGGTVPIEIVRAARELADEGRYIVISSRVGRCLVQTGTMTLRGPNILPSGILNPAKSAILLSLALAEGLSVARLTELFEQFAGVANHEGERRNGR